MLLTLLLAKLMLNCLSKCVCVEMDKEDLSIFQFLQLWNRYIFKVCDSFFQLFSSQLLQLYYGCEGLNNFVSNKINTTPIEIITANPERIPTKMYIAIPFSLISSLLVVVDGLVDELVDELFGVMLDVGEVGLHRTPPFLSI